jgi:energy-coupling factor transport system substrate-specific component
MSWIVASFAVLGVALLAGIAWYERSHPSARTLALVATLAALAALGRIAFAPLPSVKPTTDIVFIAGYVLGGAPGFAVGSVGALASNLFFGQGPWTPWQMFGWGAVGVAGALLARVAGRRLGRVPLAAACAVAALGFGVVMNVHMWVMYSGDHTLAKLGAVFATSLAFDLVHAVGSIVFCLAFGPALVRALARYRTRFEIDWRPVGAVAGVLLVLVPVALAPPPARAASADATAQYLLRAQNDDGGWGAAAGVPSAQLYTGWAALGVAATGRNPADLGVVAYLRRGAGELRDIGELERTILVLSAAGVRPRLGGHALVAELKRRQRANGSFAGRVNHTAFGVLALRSAGSGGGAVRRAADWIASQANGDGGFNFGGRGGPSGIDDTGAALQALVAAGRGGGDAARRAADWLARQQNSDGGFPLQPGGESNAQSTAWAIQGLLAAGRGSGGALAYLRSLTSASGEVRYSRSSRQTPVWVTAQAAMAFAGKSLPLRAVPRKRAPRTDSGAGGGASGGASPGATSGGGTATPAPAAPAPAPSPRATAAPTPADRKGRDKPAGRRKPAAPPGLTRALEAAVVPAGTPSPAMVTAALATLTVPDRARAAGFAAATIVAALA